VGPFRERGRSAGGDVRSAATATARLAATALEGLWLVPSQLAGRHTLHAHVRLLGSGTEPNAFDYCAVFGRLPDAVSSKDGDRRIVQCESVTVRSGATGVT
jgi:hypothetical protein